jgi:hypothetical protein
LFFFCGAGFPSFHYLAHTADVKPVQVQVFGRATDGPSVVIQVTDAPEPPVDDEFKPFMPQVRVLWLRAFRLQCACLCEIDQIDFSDAPTNLCFAAVA